MEENKDKSTCEWCEQYGLDYYTSEDGQNHWRCPNCPKNIVEVKKGEA